MYLSIVISVQNKEFLMSREYAEARIKEALTQCKGNPTKTRQKVIAWALEDVRLLQGLTKPHLTGITAHAINRVVSKQDDEPEEIHVPEVPETLDMEPETFGKEILGALSGDSAIFGEETYTPKPVTSPGNRKQASQNHIDAIYKMSGQKPDSSE